jgi:amino acid adenylation domain-containing protein
MPDLSRLLSDLPLEQRAIQAKCVHPTGTFVEFREAEIEQSIPDRFEQQVAKYPDRIAVRSKTITFTYDALNKLANRMAHAILNRCGQGAEPIAVLLEHGAPAIAAFLGALKAGKIYVPLDPSYPRARIAYMREDSQAALIVTNNRQLALAKAVVKNSRPLLDIDALDSNLSEENLGLPLPPETLYGIFYTSGSTGDPKAVVDSHRNMLYHTMTYTNATHICAEDRLTLLHSLSFRAAEAHLFGALLNGAALFPLDLKEAGIGNLAAWLNHEGITAYHSIPMVFRQFAQTLTGKLAVPTLRLIHLSGAAASRREVELYKQHCGPQCLFLHRMGFAEGFTARWYFVDQATHIAGNKVPVGYPVGATHVLLLDEAGKEVGPEDIGEIAIKSRYLAPGYWRQPHLTQAAFLTDPAGGDVRLYRTGDLGRMRSDGCLEHLGRKDFQVKIRGHRVDVGEIESTLCDHRAIKEALVTAREEPSGDPALVACIVPAQVRAPTNSELRRFLQVTLPDYMIPSAFVTLEALPLTPNGKVDYRALPAPEPLRPALEATYVAPKSEVEQRIATVWQDVLGLEQVGMDDNFFDLGGHSLLLAQVQTKLQDILQRDLPILDLFEHPSINTLAEYLSRQQQERGQTALQPGEELVEALRVGKNRRQQLSQRLQRTRGNSDGRDE